MKKNRLFGTVSLAATIWLAGLGFTGTGAHATLAGELLRGQSFGSGTPNVVLSTSDPRARGNGTSNLTLGSDGPVGSSFSTSPEPITITNEGSVTVTEFALRLTDAHANSTFEREVWVCFYSEARLYFNEPLTTVESYGWVAFLDLDDRASGYRDVHRGVLHGPHENTGCGGPYTGYRARCSVTSRAFISRPSIIRDLLRRWGRIRGRRC